MSSRILVALAASVWISLVGSAGTATAQNRARPAARRPAAEERSFLGDFRTIHECLERVARDQGLTMQFSGNGSSWFGHGSNERIEIVADQSRFPFLGNRVIAQLGRPVIVPNLRIGGEARKVELDLDTGALKGPDGGDFKDWEIKNIQIHFTLRRAEDGESCQLILAKSFPDQRIKVSVVERRQGGRAFSRELLAAVESKLKLAAKLSAARKKRRGESDKKGSDPKAKEPVPATADRPKALGSPG